MQNQLQVNYVKINGDNSIKVIRQQYKSSALFNEKNSELFVGFFVLQLKGWAIDVESKTPHRLSASVDLFMGQVRFSSTSIKRGFEYLSCFPYRIVLGTESNHMCPRTVWTKK